jgi:hypothetical protein
MFKQRLVYYLDVHLIKEEVNRLSKWKAKKFKGTKHIGGFPLTLTLRHHMLFAIAEALSSNKAISI